VNLPTPEEMYLARKGQPLLKPAAKAKKAPAPIRTQAKPKRERDAIAAIRRYVFEREKGICRCCGVQAAETMHEMRPRSLGGLISRENSIAVCGDGVRGCHGQLQRHEITVRIHSKRKGADGFLAFKGGRISSDGTERGSEPGSGRITMEWRK